MKKNVVLKAVLFLSDMTQAELSRRTGIQESDLSRGIRGRLSFTQEERQRIAEALKREPKDLFPDERS